MIDEDLIKIMKNTEGWVIDLEKKTYHEIAFFDVDEDHVILYCSTYHSLRAVSNEIDNEYEEFVIEPENFFATTDTIEFLRNEGILSNNLLIEYNKATKFEIEKR